MQRYGKFTFARIGLNEKALNKVNWLKFLTINNY